jgi:hypothetical protein
MTPVDPVIASMPYAPANVLQSSTSQPPLLSSGSITIANLRKFDYACKRFFAYKEITAEEQVGRIIYSFESEFMQSWIQAESDRLVTLTFAEFMLEIKRKWLPSDWEDELIQELIAPQGSRDFYEWSISVRKANNELEAADSLQHIPAPRFRAHLVAHLNPALRLAYRAAKKELDAIEDIEAWIHRIIILDVQLATHQKQISTSMAQAARTAAKLSTSSNRGAYTNTSGNATNSVPASSFGSNTSGPIGGFVALPKLSQPEKDLLDLHQGCYKCRTFYAGHFSRTCTADRPSLEACKKVTTAHALKAKAAFEKSSTPLVAAIFDNGLDEEFVDEDFVDSDEFNEYVPPSDISSLPDHLWWDCCIDAPFTCAPTPIRALIDHGAPPVLISEEAVEIYGLVRRKLFKPFPVSAAFVSGKKKAPPVLLEEYCRLNVLSPDAAWKSRTLNAIICPNLQADIILGLDFLVKNRIVVDAELRTAIAKDSGFDLLHPPDPTLNRTPIKMSPAVRRRRERRLLRTSHERVRELRKLVHNDLLQHFLRNPKKFNMEKYSSCNPNIISLVNTRIQQLAAQARLKKLDQKFKKTFADRFPTDIPHVRDLPTNVYHHIDVKPGASISTARAYSCPRKYREGWKTLIDQHYAAGRIRPSSSQYTSPSFIIPKADTSVLPRWVNDYRILNRATVPDNYPLPRIDDILADCAKGRIWGKIDMTNSFFQTLVHPDHVKYTATLTPFGLWEWVVMPMGLRNSPATHQRRVTLALRDLIGRICHVYLDDIIIWSQSVEEHQKNVTLVLQALQAAQLYCSSKKSTLFTTELNFLGHRVSQRGIEANGSKVERILNWPTPRSAKDVRQFLGLVRYISVFLPSLAEHTTLLTPLTRKECNTLFPPWTAEHHDAFQAIKALVVSRDCLTTIDHHNPGDNRIFIACDASQRRTGAVLSFGLTWESARPVAFESRQLRGAELHYPVHEQEMLAIIRALKKWRSDLLGSHFTIYTDHQTLQNFELQKELSKRQARWMEYMSQYDCSIQYINGADNCVADALSRLPDIVDDTSTLVTGVFEIKSDPSIVADIKEGYQKDPWCQMIAKDLSLNTIDQKFNISSRNGLLFLDGRLIIPKYNDLRTNLFRLAHDSLGHFGADKSYASLRNDFYWPNMRRDLVNAYVPSCTDCQRNKNKTSKPTGPLHPLPVPDKRFDSVAIDFIGPLPEDDGFNCIVTMTDRLGADIQIAPCNTSMTAEEFAELFFNRWFCENGCPLELITDRDKLFVSRFWRKLMKLSGINHKMSTAFHPQTDGSSERSNKTVIQALRFHVERNQSGWAKALHKVRFDIMNTVNSSTGYTPFMLKSAHSPRLIPPLVFLDNPTPNDTWAPNMGSTPGQSSPGSHDAEGVLSSPPHEEAHQNLRNLDNDNVTPTASCEGEDSALVVFEQLADALIDAKDSLTAAKISQAYHANKDRSPEPEFKVGDRVLLATANRRREYMQAKDGRVAKFMPRFDGPFEIVKAFPDSSTYTLRMPEHTKIHRTFHSSLLRAFIDNDSTLFPSRTPEMPGPIVTADGEIEYFVERIIDQRTRGRGKQFLVRWLGYGPEADLWLPRREIADTEAYAEWQKKGTHDT